MTKQQRDYTKDMLLPVNVPVEYLDSTELNCASSNDGSTIVSDDGSITPVVPLHSLVKQCSFSSPIVFAIERNCENMTPKNYLLNK